MANDKLDQLRLMREQTVSRAEAKTDKPPIPASREFTAPPGAVAVVATNLRREGSGPANYKYRDADKWRDYMRGYMRTYRNKPTGRGR